MHVVANPLINITLQGRHDTYPKRRGMTRVPELLAAGVNVAFGHDCVMDPWYSLGSADMLEVAHMGLHVAQMTSTRGDARLLRRGHRQRAPKSLGLEGYGLEPGCHRRLRAAAGARPGRGDPPARRRGSLVVRRGEVIAETAAVASRLNLAGQRVTVDFRHETPSTD